MIKGLNSNSDWKNDFDDTTLERGRISIIVKTLCFTELITTKYPAQ